MKVVIAAALIVPGVALIAAPQLAAHPHVQIEQQAHLSLGRTRAVVTYHLIPPQNGGAHLFDHIDTNGDGALNAAEKLAFAKAVTGQSTLVADKAKVPLTVTHYAFPDRATMVKHGGVIKVRGSAQLTLNAGQRHRVSFAVGYTKFSKRWFVQPFYYPDVQVAKPVLNRPRGSNAVEIVF